MDHQAIESRLRGAPSDLSAWVAYSEHLIAQGDPRGPIIRLSLQRGHAPASSERFVRLSAELDRLYAEGTPQISCLVREAKIDWKYGFVVGVELPCTTAAIAGLSALLESPDAVLLRSLRFTPAREQSEEDEEEEWSEEGADVDAIPEPTLVAEASALSGLDLRNLRMLAMPYCLIGAEGVSKLLSSSQLGPLLALDLRYCYIGDVGAAAIASTPQLAGLRSLWLPRCGITGKGIEALAKSPHLRQLRLLDLRYNKIGSRGAKAIASSPIAAELLVLQVFRSEIKKAGADALAQSPHLPLAVRRMWRGQ